MANLTRLLCQECGGIGAIPFYGLGGSMVLRLATIKVNSDASI